MIVTGMDTADLERIKSARAISFIGDIKLDGLDGHGRQRRRREVGISADGNQIENLFRT